MKKEQITKLDFPKKPKMKKSKAEIGVKEGAGPKDCESK